MIAKLGVVVLLVATVVSCGPDQGAATASLRADFPLIERLRVKSFMSVEGCDYLVYERGAFVTNPSSAACVDLLGGDLLGQDPTPSFDAQATADLNALIQGFEANGPRLQHAFLELTVDGRIADDSRFGFSLEEDYVYKPSAETRASYVDSTCAEQVDADWYRVWPC